MTPVTLSVGVGVVARMRHTKPAEHRPVGDVSAGVAQKLPALHGVHSADVARLLRLLNVPLGHANCVAVDVPAGQKYPAVHGVGCTAPCRQYMRAGHVLHDDTPVTLEYVPAAHSVDDDTPDTQNEPAGHAASRPFTLPPLHTYPAGHTAYGTTVALSGQKKPGVHDWHADALAARVLFRNVPGGHVVGYPLPAGQ